MHCVSVLTQLGFQDQCERSNNREFYAQLVPNLAAKGIDFKFKRFYRCSCGHEVGSND